MNRYFTLHRINRVGLVISNIYLPSFLIYKLKLGIAFKDSIFLYIYIYMSKLVNLCRYIFSFHTSMRIYQLHIYVTVLFSAFLFLFIVFLLLWLEIFCQADLVPQ